MKPWRLSQPAERSLIEIAAWTGRHFGREQALAYRDALIDRIEALASGRPPHARSCDLLVPGKRKAGELKYARQGAHYLIIRETEDALEVVEILHERMDLERHIEALTLAGRSNDSV